MQITLIKVIDDDVSFKRYFGEVRRESMGAVYFRDTHRDGRQRTEPVEMRQQLGECERRNLEKDFAFLQEL